MKQFFLIAIALSVFHLNAAKTKEQKLDEQLKNVNESINQIEAKLNPLVNPFLTSGALCRNTSHHIRINTCSDIKVAPDILALIMGFEAQLDIKYAKFRAICTKMRIYLKQEEQQ